MTSIERVVREDGRVVVYGSGGGISWPVVIVNPPVMVPDGDGWREDPDEAVRIIVAQLGGD